MVSVGRPPGKDRAIFDGGNPVSSGPYFATGNTSSRVGTHDPFKDGAIEKPRTPSNLSRHPITNFMDSGSDIWEAVVDAVNADSRLIDVSIICQYVFECKVPLVWKV